MPPNPLFSALAASGSSVFAAGFSPSGGVFRSDDQGNHWTVLDTGLSNVMVAELAAVGTDIFAALADGRVIRSSSQGEKWTLVNTGLSLNTGVTSFAVIGADIFAGTSSRVAINGQVNGGVIRSSDQGESWTGGSAGLPNLAVQALAALGTNLFAGTAGGAFRSTNRGENWIAVNEGLNGLGVRSLIVVGEKLFAGTFSSGVFVTELEQ